MLQGKGKNNKEDNGNLFFHRMTLGNYVPYLFLYLVKILTFSGHSEISKKMGPSQLNSKESFTLGITYRN